MKYFKIPAPVGEITFSTFLVEVLLTTTYWRTNGAEVIGVGRSLRSKLEHALPGVVVALSETEFLHLKARVTLPDVPTVLPTALEAIWSFVKSVEDSTSEP